MDGWMDTYGNVKAQSLYFVSDGRGSTAPHTSTDSFTITGYEPAIKSITDYYPYGMQMPDRCYSDGTTHTTNISASGISTDLTYLSSSAFVPYLYIYNLGMRDTIFIDSVHIDSATYEPYHVLSSISSSDGYAYGFNGQMKVNEWAGSGNHNTALFWEYDVRTGRRGNRDPVVNPQNSPYSVFNLNPLMNNDVLGDVVKTDVKGWVNTKGGIKGILHNKKNPIDYNPTTGELVFDYNLDISNYTDLQKNVLNRYEKLIRNLDVVTTIRILGRNDEIITADGKVKTTLSNEGANGWTYTAYDFENIKNVVKFSEVYITDKPVFRNGEPEEDEYAFTVNIHEVAGHAYQNLTNPPTGESAKIKNANNKEVEKLMNEVFKVFWIDGSIWYKDREADNHKEYK